jgi:hypothetical protein
MIIVRSRAEFRADFPDDHIWNDDESDVVQTGGKAVAQAIADILAGFGCVIEVLEDNVGHCWECSFSYQRLALVFRVVDVDGCVLTFEEPHRVTRKLDRYYDVLLKANEQLRRDGRFHDLVWCSYDDRRVGAEAFQTPVAGYIPAADQPVQPVEKKPSFLRKLLAPLGARADVR